MNKTGGIGLLHGRIVLLIIGILVFIGATILLVYGSNSVADAIVTFEDGTPEASSVTIIGYNLAVGQVYHYNAREWVEVGSGDFRIGDYSLNGQRTKDAFIDFYYNGRKKPDQFINEDGNYRTSKINQIALVYGVQVEVTDTVMPPYVGNPEDFEYAVTHRNRINVFEEGDGWTISVDNVFDSPSYYGVVDKIKNWRDQVLEGNEYEKYLFLESNTYKVKQEGTYLYFDLREPVGPLDPQVSLFESSPDGENEDRSGWTAQPIGKSMISFDNDLQYKGVAWLSKEFISCNRDRIRSSINTNDKATFAREGWYVVEEDNVVEGVPFPVEVYTPVEGKRLKHFEFQSSVAKDYYQGLHRAIGALDDGTNKFGVKAEFYGEKNEFINSFELGWGTVVGNHGLFGTDGWSDQQQEAEDDFLRFYNSCFHDPEDPIPTRCVIDRPAREYDTSGECIKLAEDGSIIPEITTQIDPEGVEESILGFKVYDPFSSEVQGYNPIFYNGIDTKLRMDKHIRGDYYATVREIDTSLSSRYPEYDQIFHIGFDGNIVRDGQSAHNPSDYALELINNYKYVRGGDGGFVEK